MTPLNKNKLEIIRKISQAYNEEAESYLQKRIWMHSYILKRIIQIVHHTVTLTAINLILNVGSGPGWLETKLLQNDSKKWVSLDISPLMIKNVKFNVKSVDGVIADAHLLPFKGNIFDLIICMRVIKFLDRCEFLAEIKRILKNRGWLLILFDCGDALWVKFLERLNVLVDVGVNRKTLTTKDLLSELKSFGFKIYACYPVTAMPLSLFNYIPKSFWSFLRLIDLPKLWGARLNIILCRTEV